MSSNSGGNCELRVFFINTAGKAATRVPAAIAAHPGHDVYCFVETMVDEHSCLEVQYAGYEAHHCTRPRQARGRTHGGITVLLKQASPVVGHGCSKRVREDVRAGIMWIDLPSRKLTLAVAYFSPASSRLYSQGVLDTQPCSILWHGLKTAIDKQHQCIVLGDFNTRVGIMDDDVPNLDTVAMSPMADGNARHFVNTYSDIPTLRRNADTRVPNREAALNLLHGLNTVQCVLLNGRVTGDEHGHCTFVRKGSDGQVTGSSTIDFAIVSASLYSNVQKLTIYDHVDDNLSHDHCPISLQLALQPQRVALADVRSHSRRVVYRPVGPVNTAAYCHALSSTSHAFRQVLRDMQEHSISIEQGLQRLSDIVVTCARRMPRASNDNRSRRHHTGGAPWFDDECGLCAAHFKAAWAVHLACPHDEQLHSAGLQARKAYKAVLARKKYAYKQQLQVQHLQTYFSMQQGQFWKAFLGKRDSACPITDVDEWTDWFCSIMGSPVDAHDTTGPHYSDVATSLHALHVVSPDSMNALNAPITVDEVIEILQALPNGKAADLHGMTCELLRLAAVRVPSSPRHDSQDVEYICEPLVACLTHILQNLTAEGCMPAVLQVSKLTPVPKSGQASARLDKNMYRGISVASIFSKVVDKLLHKRLDGRVEQLKLRATTQCGFRKGHGTLDALFTLTHAINLAKFKKKRLYVVFVDFKKAFDTVRRDVMIDRCKQLGVHGQFLDTLLLLYDKVRQQVCIGGEVGRLFDTYLGTKQGSELSPLLFGMFIDVLHELIQMQVPGAGPVLGNMRVPDITYADDVTLIALDDPQQAQHLLDCLSVFCAIFKMEVNQDELKTCAVVFRCRNTKVPQGVVLRYRGDVVPFKDQYLYLGVLLHATQNFMGAVDALAASGDRAMHAVLGRCRQQCITQFDLKCRIFDRLVEPILSYGSQVWGPDIFASKVASDKILYSNWSSAERVHICYLRRMAGIGDGCIEVLLRDFNRTPVMHHWVLLAARWFMTLKYMSCDRLAHCAWVGDIELMLEGCQDCWTYKLLHTMTLLGVIERNMWDPKRAQRSKHDIMSLQLLPKSIKLSLAKRMALRWATLHADPRVAPSARIEMCTHAAWVLKMQEGSCEVPKHLKLCSSFVVQQCLARLRLGGHDLQIRLGRMKKRSSRVPRCERLCRLCSTAGAAFHAQRAGAACVEDLRHFLLDCPAYQHVRLRYRDVFGNATTTLSIFDCSHQDQLAQAAYTMTKFREQCLLAPQGSNFQLEVAQQAVEDDVELVRMR
jgi:exonuclease III